MVLAKDIDAVLPQTQCGECGYPGCMPYAQAIVAGVAPLTLCPPGGMQTIQKLAILTGRGFDDDVSEVSKKFKKPQIAKIREEDCIGCTKCIPACPVDAILGSAKHMHVIIDTECTGCCLCVEPCPVDCIELIDLPELNSGEFNYSPDLARTRYNAKKIRELKEIEEKSARYLEKRNLAKNELSTQEDKIAKQKYILQALERAKKKLDKSN